MYTLCIILIVFGAGIMLYSIGKYYKSLLLLKTQIKADKLFSNLIYAACFAMMIFFLAGYLFTAIVNILKTEITVQDLLIAAIFFFGAVFVFAMVTMVRRMFIVMTDKAELKKRLQQQELMSAISQSFTTVEDPQKLIHKALRMAGEFINVNHAFLSQHRKEQNILECISEWHDKTGRPFIGSNDKWPFTQDMEYYDDLFNVGHANVNDFRLLRHPNFEAVKEHRLGAFLNFPIIISGKFWGILGFIIYERSHAWDEGDIYLGKLIAGIFSGAIARNMADEALVRAKEAAEQASKSKSEFLSRMSHEMRTPMNAIIGMTAIGKNSHEIARKDYCFEKVQTASSHLLGVVNDILDMSKIEANKLELSNVNFNLKKMLEKIININSFQVEEKEQHLILSVEEDVPHIISSDEQRLGQVLTNLLANAIKFTPNEGTVSVFVRKLTDGDGTCTLQFEVKDTGIGISAEQQAKLFKSFEQADGSISRKYGGTGLGLAISKRLVEMMNGTIRVESELGVGTSFIFNIRAGTVQQGSFHDESIEENIFAVPEKYTQDCFKHKRILIAEDIEINREIVAALLEFTGITIDFAEDGRMAFEIFALNPSIYDMIFMDIHMPEVDGYEAARMIRGLSNPCAKIIPIIAMTADVFREDIEKCLLAGMNDHVGKPLEMENILTKISLYDTKQRHTEVLASH